MTEQSFWFLKTDQPFDDTKGTFHRMPYTFCGKSEALAFVLGCAVSFGWNPGHIRETVSPEMVEWAKSSIYQNDEMKEKYKSSDDLLKSLSWPPQF